MIMQYGRILDIDLKIPPRPPGYAFVEVRISGYGLSFKFVTTALLPFSVLQSILDRVSIIKIRKQTCS